MVHLLHRLYGVDAPAQCYCGEFADYHAEAETEGVGHSSQPRHSNGV